MINGPGTDTPTGLYEEEGGATSLFYSRGGGDRGREQLLAEGPLTKALTLEVSKYSYCLYEQRYILHEVRFLMYLGAVDEIFFNHYSNRYCICPNVLPKRFSTHNTVLIVV